MEDRALKKPDSGSGSPLPGLSGSFRRLDSIRLRAWLACLAILLILFSTRLFAWLQFARESELFSYVLLIPIVSAYLVSLKMRELKVDGRPGWPGSLTFLAIGTALVSLDFVLRARGVILPHSDAVALSIASFLAFLASSLFIFLGPSFVKQNAFAVVFLVFMIPFPTAVEHGIEVFFQKTSAEVAATFLNWCNVPVFREGVIFRLPGIVIEVAKECSGIRSSLVLFLVSLVGGILLLRTVSCRIILALVVIPLAIVRNGFRILTISLLCVHVNPEMIDSPIHHRGGPIFFALSLIPFFGLLLLLRRWERKRVHVSKTNENLR